MKCEFELVLLLLYTPSPIAVFLYILIGGLNLLSLSYLLDINDDRPGSQLFRNYLLVVVGQYIDTTKPFRGALFGPYIIFYSYFLAASKLLIQKRSKELF